jgi:hypothetical protein
MRKGWGRVDVDGRYDSDQLEESVSMAIQTPLLVQLTIPVASHQSPIDTGSATMYRTA